MAKQNKIHIEYNLKKRDILAIVTGFVVVVFAAAFAAISYTPLRYFVKGYPSEETKSQINNDRMLIDSLQRSLYRWDLYTTNLCKILEGDTPVPLDSLLKRASLETVEADNEMLEDADSTLRSMMIAQEAFLTEEDLEDTDIEGRHFFRPLNGTVSGNFDSMQHPYINITAPQGSSVKSVLEGTVISADWSAGSGWNVVVQHGGGIISIYRNCSSVLKKVQDKITAGAAIAVLGDANSVDGKGSLRFELWNNGECINPLDFIKF